MLTINYLIIGIFVHEKAHNVTSDKTSTTGNDNVLHIILIFFAVKMGRSVGY